MSHIANQQGYALLSVVPEAIIEPIEASCIKLLVDDLPTCRAFPSRKLIEFPYIYNSPPIVPYLVKEQDAMASCRSLQDFMEILLPNYNFVRGEIAFLPPNSNIHYHIDFYEFHSFSRRLHVPIITNEKCINLWNIDKEESIHMERGFLYEINNQVLHAARNESDEIRVHVVFDVALK